MGWAVPVALFDARDGSHIGDVGVKPHALAGAVEVRKGSTAAQQTSPLDSVRSEPTFQFCSSYRLPGFSPRCRSLFVRLCYKKGPFVSSGLYADVSISEL